MGLFNFKKKENEATTEMNVITDDATMNEEEAGLTKTFNAEQQEVEAVEKTAVFNSEDFKEPDQEYVKGYDENFDYDAEEGLDYVEEKKSKRKKKEEEYEEEETDSLEELDEDEDYEYVTPQYGRKAFKITLFFIVVGMAISFFVFKDQMSEQIRNNYLNSGYAATQVGATATAADIKEGKTAYVMGKLVTGTYVELDTTLATATAADILKGYTAYANGTKITGTITTYSGSSMITPGTKDIKIAKGTYLPDGVFIAGEGNLLAKYIKAGVKIFGITGTYK